MERMLPSGGRSVNGDRVQSVVRAFSLMRHLASVREPVSLGSISTESGLPKSTVSRLLSTLESIGMVERGPADGTYGLGPAVASISTGAPTASRMQGVAQTYLTDLVERFGESAALAVADGDGLIYTDQVHSQNPIQVPDWSGHRFAPHTVAAGFVLMAWWPAARLDHYLGQDLRPSSTRTLIDPHLIRRRLDQVRNRGYVWALDEWVEGVSAVAAPVLSESSMLSAVITVFGPSYRFPAEADQTEIGGVVAETGEAIARHLDPR